MEIGFKIKKLREQSDLSQYLLANELNISQSELSKIENGQTKKIDFLLMDKVCIYFEKDLNYFTTNDNILNKNVDKNEGSVVGFNNGTTNFFLKNIIDEIKKLIEENKQKDLIIEALREEGKKYREY
jgi:transcriptional regulator with XRE-family HTH domain